MSDKDRPSERDPDAPKRLTPADVQQKQFRSSFRGYNEREVDEFLDRVTEELQRYDAEVMRLHTERAAIDPADLDLDAESQRILGQARERADAIVREAEARAAGIPTASGAETRAIVAPYLNREREFLQRLGGLVQEHAQLIRTMVEEARRRTEPPTADASSGAEAGGGEPDRRTQHDVADRNVVVIPEDAHVAAAADAAVDEQRPGSDRSLRELFWGED